MQQMSETWVHSLGWEYPLVQEVSTHSTLSAWEIPWTEETRGVAKSRTRLTTRASKQVEGKPFVSEKINLSGSFFPKDMKPVPTAGPIHSLWGLLTSLAASVYLSAWISQHVPLSLLCPFTCCLSASPLDDHWTIRRNKNSVRLSCQVALPSKQVGGPGAPTEVCRPGW